MRVINEINLAIIVITGWDYREQEFIGLIAGVSVPYFVILNIKNGCEPDNIIRQLPAGIDAIALNLAVSEEDDHPKIMDTIRKNLPESSYKKTSFFPAVSPVQIVLLVLLVCPIDSEAPAGRMILPQVQAIRDLLDRNAMALVVQPSEVPAVFEKGIDPALVVTDSQVFAEVRAMVPPHVELTSFSILLAQTKGDPAIYSAGLTSVEDLTDGSRVLIAENCSHQISCEDIGRVKIPRWLGEYTGKKLKFEFVSGLDPLPDDLPDFSLMVQCGGCMVTRSQLQNRIRRVHAAGVPVVNYGMLIKKIRIG